MNRKILLGSLAAVAIAVPALAQINGPRERPGRAEAMTRTHVESRIKDRFAATDLNGDGAVTTEEAKQARDARRKVRHDRRFAKLDVDKTGSISRAEFDAAAEARADRPRRRHGMRREMMEGGLVARADANEDGRITLNEMLAPAMDRFDRADANRDGTITPEERRDTRQKIHEERRAKGG